MNKELEHAYFSFIYKRQFIWYKRFVLEDDPPWTDDPVMSKYKIINMYRELDRCTKYIIFEIGVLSSREAKLLNIIFFRFFNADQLYQNLGLSPFEKLDAEMKNKLLQGFAKMRQEEKTLFNPAYIISPGHSTMPKHETILNNLEDVSKNISSIVDNIDASLTPEESFLVLRKIPLVGPFLACEFWTDLAYIDFFPRHWNDDDFVNIGPGAKWGLEILAGEKLNAKKQWELLNHLHDVQRDILPTIHKELNQELSWEDIAYKKACSNVPYLSLTNIEGALCEFRKYYRLSRGLGRRRHFIS
ncbi:MAG: hypothetical protein COX81_04060 [Candidatus Magasanikbacteria bacterium CG_4_10_14_0_2_um_filter_37_12]|uniref:5-hmdU DNA kinase helical domain-containing protein n=1 Tax=Candidatus Magasanikbacteria bacterium CG_4_10_14_0_2_um_filter_37_12 TaxID=1974637 RepID=A0A2M7V6G5_9BACT|nr:MAG: hypothetical protein COX81_04060 [Candidatus Magasanikbacteria bacterium CG_4_10_14_0_2_um_filter_37_12]